MRYVRLNIRRVAFLAAVVVAVVVAGSLAPGPRQAYAADIVDPTGVFCADITVTLPGPIVVAGIILARFEYPFPDLDPDQAGIQDTAITAVPYVPETTATCQTPQSALATPPANQTADRPSLTGMWDQANDKVTGSVCSTT